MVFGREYEGRDPGMLEDDVEGIMTRGTLRVRSMAGPSECCNMWWGLLSNVGLPCSSRLLGVLRASEPTKRWKVSSERLSSLADASAESGITLLRRFVLAETVRATKSIDGPPSLLANSSDCGTKLARLDLCGVTVGLLGLTKFLESCSA